MNVQRIVRLLALLVILTAGVVMVGWFLDIAALKSILPVWATMKFSTALSFAFSGLVLMGASIHLATQKPATEWLLSISSFIVLLLMSSLIVSVFLGIKTGIEDLFVSESGGAVLTTVPGRPSVGTMYAFILTGLFGALVGFNAIKDQTMRALGLLVSLLGVTALVGYSVDAPVLYYAIEDKSTAMAFHTAVLFVMLGIGMLFLSRVPGTDQSRMRIRDKSRSVIFLSLFVMCVFGIVLSATNRLQAQTVVRQIISAKISEELFARNVLLVDHFFSTGSSERIEEQLRLVDARIDTSILAARNHFIDGEAHEVYEQLLASRSSVQTDMSRLSDVLAAEHAEDGVEAHRELEKQLVSKILLQSQVTADKARSLGQISIDQLVATQKRATKMFVITLIAVALYAAYVSLMMLRTVVRPVQRLLHGAKAMADGDFTQHVEVYNKDELGDLSEAFNSMVNRLKMSRGNLEKEVKDRTAELESLKGSLEKSVNEKTKELRAVKDHLEEEVVLRTQELEEKVQELEKINSIMVGRELRMSELKKRLKQHEETKKSEDVN